MQNTDQLNLKMRNRYKLYSKFYPVMAMLVYWIVWRGKIFRHIGFFRELASSDGKILDIATGDGSLTKAALFGGGKRPKFVTCIDLSPDMNARAAKKLKGLPVEIILGDVQQLPYADSSWNTIACFGGVNSFANPQAAFTEMRRVLAPGGKLRGSALLQPAAPWRRRLIEGYIEDGYQTIAPSFEDMNRLFERSGFTMSQYQRNGDVLLFELSPR